MRSDQEFTTLADRNWQRLVNTAMLLGAPLHEAEDLTQTTLTKAYVSWRRVCRASDRDAYLTQMLVNTFRASRRRKWQGEVPTSALPDRTTSVEPTIGAAPTMVLDALARLSAKHREVVIVRYFLDYSVEQSAQVLKISSGTVKSRLSRALEQLRGDADILELQIGDHA